MNELIRIKNNKYLIGGFITYIIFLFFIPYQLLLNNKNSFFIFYVSNLDILMNILSFNYPSYFKFFYNIKPKTTFEYVSFELINLVSLLGILTYGFSLKNKYGSKANDIHILSTIMIIITITWILPTNLITTLTIYIGEYIIIDNLFKKILVSSFVGLFFITIEFLILNYVIDTNPLFNIPYKINM